MWGFLTTDNTTQTTAYTTAITRRNTEEILSYRFVEPGRAILEGKRERVCV